VGFGRSQVGFHKGIPRVGKSDTAQVPVTSSVVRNPRYHQYLRVRTTPSPPFNLAKAAHTSIDVWRAFREVMWVVGGLAKQENGSTHRPRHHRPRCPRHPPCRCPPHSPPRRPRHPPRRGSRGSRRPCLHHCRPRRPRRHHPRCPRCRRPRYPRRRGSRHPLPWFLLANSPLLLSSSRLCFVRACWPLIHPGLNMVSI